MPPHKPESQAQAQAADATAKATIDLGPIKGLGIGLVVIGAALGIGRIGGQAMEAMGRQPEAAAKIQTAMIIAAALIEGLSFFAIVFAK